jgi:hypothetical protein
MALKLSAFPKCYLDVIAGRRSMSVYAYNQAGKRYYGPAFACDGDKPGTARRLIWDGFDGARGVQRLSVQLDLAKGSARAWVNGVEAKVNTAGMGPIDPAGGTRFRANEYAPFNLWATTYDQGSWGNSEDLTARGNSTVYGLRMGYAPRYDSAADGKQVAVFHAPDDRPDAPTDAFRYGAGDAAEKDTLVCYLDTTTPPTADYPGRYVYMNTGDYYGRWRALGLFVYSQLEIQTPAVSNQSFSGFKISGGGDAISLGCTLDTTFRDILAMGGWRGIGSIHPYWPSYVVHVQDCSLYGADAAYYGWDQIVRGRNLDCMWGGNGHTMLRFVGSDVVWSGLLSGGMSATDALIKCHAGGYASRYIFKDIVFDVEGGPGPNQATIWCERHPAGMTTLHVEDIFPGQFTGSGRGPMVRLVDRYGEAHKGVGRFTLRRPLAASGILVQADSMKWEGSIEDIPSGAWEPGLAPIEDIPSGAWEPGLAPVVSGDPANPDYSNVTTSLRLDALPKAGTYLRGTEVIIRGATTSGQPRRYINRRSGTVGGDPAPDWAVMETVP